MGSQTIVFILQLCGDVNCSCPRRSLKTVGSIVEYSEESVLGKSKAMRIWILLLSHNWSSETDPGCPLFRRPAPWQDFQDIQRELPVIIPHFKVRHTRTQTHQTHPKPHSASYLHVLPIRGHIAAKLYTYGALWF